MIPTKHFLLFAKISHIIKMNPERLVARIFFEDFDVGSDSLELSHIPEVFLLFKIVLGSTELLLKLIVIILVLGSIMLVAVFFIRRRIIRASIFVVIVGELIIPTAVSIVLEDMLAAGNGEP